MKAATTDDTSRFLNAERDIYTGLHSPFLPEIVSSGDDGRYPFIVMEDLSGWTWPPPWTAAQIDLVLETCSAIADTPVPDGFEGDLHEELLADYWPKLAANPEPLLALGVARSDWFAKAFDILVEVERAAVVAGDSLVHADIRSDNLCITGDTVKIVDWNWAYVGNAMLDVVAWLPSLRLEGGPAPWELLHGETPPVAHVAGFFLYHAIMPPNPSVRGDLRAFQRSPGAVALEWAARELTLEPPS